MIFAEFEGNFLPDERAGRRRREVPPRLLARPRHRAPAARSTCRCRSNPSHLEAVNPVVEGIVRAKQHRLGDASAQRGACRVLMHGDAAFTGQGVVAGDAQPLRARRLPHRRHDPRHRQQPDRLHHVAARTTASRRYPTDVAKMIQAPVFHVNGDDPEAVVQAARLAIDVPPAVPEATWSSTSSATAGTATTRSTSRPSRSR